MPSPRYVSSEERKQMQQDVVKHAIKIIEGPVGFLEHWPNEEPQLHLTEDARKEWRPFCKMIWRDDERKKRCIENHEKRAVSCHSKEITTCWLGIQNIACCVSDEHGNDVTLMGGVFHLREEQEQSVEYLEQFLSTLPTEGEREKLRKAWHELPIVGQKEVEFKIRELELAGQGYLFGINQRSEFRYAVDLMVHDMVIALQAMIAKIEVLQIELKEAFSIGKKWDKRFEDLIETCENHDKYLETYLQSKLMFGRSEYTNESISQLIYECVETYRPQASARAIDFRVNLQQITDSDGSHQILKVFMNQVVLRQAFQNLIDNAVKYSFSGSVSHPRWVEIKGWLETRDVPGYVIAISNLGVGIEPDELLLVFERRYQGRRRLGEERSGHGLGLTFVKECIERHRGDITIQSFPSGRTGWLTIVEIWLPISTGQ